MALVGTTDDIAPTKLPALWKARGDTLEKFGDPNSARLWRMAAAELDRAFQAFGDDTVSIAEAARVSGYTASYISKQINEGLIPNAGRKHAPRVRSRDIKPKPLRSREPPKFAQIA